MSAVFSLWLFGVCLIVSAFAVDWVAGVLGVVGLFLILGSYELRLALGLGGKE